MHYIKWNTGGMPQDEAILILGKFKKHFSKNFFYLIIKWNNTLHGYSIYNNYDTRDKIIISVLPEKWVIFNK
jgi:hypothetical protein